MGNRHPNITPYETFATTDGEIAVAVGSERQWLRFCEALAMPDLAADPRFATNGERVRNRDALRPILAAAFERRPAAEWLAALTGAEVPAGQVRDMAQVFDDPQVLARDMVVSVDHPTIGEVKLTGIPWKLVGDARLDPPPAAAPWPAHRRDPGGARLLRGRGGGAPRRRHGLRLSAPPQSPGPVVSRDGTGIAFDRPAAGDRLD